MIDIKDKKDCCGCNACIDICPKHAISQRIDNEGFWYPVVDPSKCVDCGLCDRTCPIIHAEELKKNEFHTPVCFAAIHKSVEVRFGSTTGGLFSALAELMYADGGYVGGAVYDEEFKVRHFISNHLDDLLRLRQSKYSQSDTLGFYKEVKRLLSAGEKVLVCGTPCQMAALRRFLNKGYENLIIVDFICKSITSPLFYAKYLDYWERKAGSKLVSFKFKDKELGWRNLVKRFDFQNGKTLYSRAQDHDLYSAAYHGHIVSRPSCYDCQFKDFPRISDITIADFWGVEKFDDLKKLDDNAGTSAVICNNTKGLDYFRKLKGRVEYKEANINQIIPGNPALIHTEVFPKNDRAAFFQELQDKPIEEVVPRYVEFFGRNHGKKAFLKAILRPIRQMWHYGGHSPWQILRFIYFNFFCGQVKSRWMENGLVYPTPYSVLEFQKGSIVDLHGPLIVGEKKVRKSREETRLLVEAGGLLTVKTAFRLGYGSDVEVFEHAELLIDECGTNYGCTLICGKKITMNGHVSLGRNVSIRDTNAHLIAVDGYRILRPVIIEHHVWICSGAVICPGVKVKEGAVVGASSFVIQNVPAHSLVSGYPAKVVQRGIAWKL